MNKATDQISVGETDTLVATVSPANATNRSVTWSSSSPDVATVSGSGLVSAAALGTAVITVTTDDGGMTATCTVTVVISATGVTLSRATATVGIGETVPLTATVVPANATNPGVTWSTSDAGVATVAATGLSAVVTTVGAGTAAITVSTLDGNKTAICVVTVARKAQWAKVPASATSSPTLSAVAVDGTGHIYVAGIIGGTDPHSFGNSVTAIGAYSGNNALVVKYDATGNALWARTVNAGEGASAFSGLATDSAGNVFAAGTIEGNTSYDFGSSVLVASPYRWGTSLVLVKYDPSGAAKWAKSIIAGSGDSSYVAVTTDSSGSPFAAGSISGSLSYALGNGATAGGPDGTSQSALLAKYGADGSAQWARTTISGTGASVFNAVAVAGTGNLYAAGYFAGTLPLGFGNTVTATGNSILNALLVQYDAGGTAHWARTAAGGSGDTGFAALAADDAGDVFVGGWIYGNTSKDFGSGVAVAGAYSASSSVLLLKYNSSGITTWGQSLTSATGLSQFSSLALDQTGHLYAVGVVAGPGSFAFGSSIALTSASNGNEVLLASYNTDGKCQAAQTAAAGASISGFSAVAADSAANIYAAGYINGSSAVDFGNSVSVAGAYSSGDNAVLVKYR
ncbi:MAG: Ig-like domain-containing protein [Polyangia bacterium]